MNSTILKKAEDCRKACADFLRDLVRVQSFSTGEKEVALRIKKEMEKLGFDQAWIDDYGNVIGRIGQGPTRIVYDGHIDTVGIGNRESWPYHPFEGKVEEGYIYGRGASDNKAASAVQVYGAKIFQETCSTKDFSIFVVGSIQEEDCDGLALKYALEKSIGNVHFVCMGEATDLNVYRGHRGRMEIKVRAKGRSCHGSAPERGTNAIYKMTKLIQDLEALNERLQTDAFLGKGTLAVTHITAQTPSLCAVPDGCEIHIDRRLTWGEDKALAIKQIHDLPGFDHDAMEIVVPIYKTPSYTGKILQTECFFPTWVLPEKHPLVRAGHEAAKKATPEQKPIIDKWVFSTNGVSSMGQLNIPTIGYGPAKEDDAHTTNDRVKIDDLVKSMAFYAFLPGEIGSQK
ncbi:MAG: YgeY family selenium metabolism-linked hydrolase [Bdellovibrio sp.]|nr:YgeY family selenium metabolism-linked hydrolase [Bdellovibrio sp.]